MSKCEICGGRAFRNEEVEDVFQLGGRYVLVEHIPATVCVQCGEKTFEAATAEAIRQMLHDGRQATRKVDMEVFAY